MKRFIPSLATGLIVIFCFLPLVGQGFGAAPNIDNRHLNTLPKWENSLAVWFSKFDDYLNDHFGFRGQLVRLNRTIRDHLGEDPPKVTRGKDNWLFLSNPNYRSEFEGRGNWNEENVNNWIEAIGALKTIADQRDIPFAAMIAVDKSQIFSEKLPSNWVGPSSRRFRTKLYNHPNAAKVGLIDPEPALQEAKAKGIAIYQVRDTHWNSTGAYIATELLWEKIDPLRERNRFIFDGNYISRKGTLPRDLEQMAGYKKQMNL